MTRLPITNQQGYTLTELLLAMALFSAMLLILSLGFLFTIRLYNNGLSNRDSQTSTSFGMDEMLRDVRAAYAVGATPSGTTPPLDQLCLGLAGRNVVYKLASPSPGSPLALTRYNATATGPNNALTCSPDISSAQAVSSSAVKLSSLGITINAPTPTSFIKGIISVTITLKGAATSGVTTASGNCTASSITSGFCATTTLVSSASLRGSQGE